MSGGRGVAAKAVAPADGSGLQSIFGSTPGDIEGKIGVFCRHFRPEWWRLRYWMP
jgi:hypothetical protein